MMRTTTGTFAVLVGMAFLNLGCEGPSNTAPSGLPALEYQAGPTSLAARRPVAPEVKAGSADDNAQYNHYLGYLDRFANIQALKLDVSGRVVFTALDAQGRCLPNCDLTVTSPDGKVLCRRRTYADGRAMFFPNEIPDRRASAVKVEARWGGAVVSRQVDLQGPHTVELRFGSQRPPFRRVPLDVAFIIDTTGSMGDEIAKLKQTLEAIHFQVTQMTPTPDARFAMVVYRDRGDAYVTKVTPFTDDIQRFAAELRAVTASGGGDEPEDLQEALRRAARDLHWRDDAVKLAFVLGDAPPHLDYGRQFTYVDFLREAARAGIKTTAIGASGLKPQGEYIFRQLAQYTMGLFVFLTYGESGESEGGTPWTVSHHTGDNWQARNLDTIIVQAVARELSHLSDTPVRPPADYFQARPGKGVPNSAVLEELFTECARQLVGFSQIRIEASTPAAVLPVQRGDGCPAAVAESLGDHLSLALSREKSLKLVERGKLQEVLDELDLNRLSEFEATPAGGSGPPAGGGLAGRQCPAKILVLSKVRLAADGYDMFVKMVRVETGEILSASMLRIDPQLATPPPA
ncbi:MAG TPA: vWA domain-containing protein, partial [Phycisphaerae bacterium]|nr:vWA domain-containing protein [Phycisphaerae bacterium]